MISLPSQRRLTQGTIFCSAQAEGYEDCPTWGIVITARCDAAHEKTQYVNYIPVVRIEDWLNRDGGLIIIDRALSEHLNKFANLLATKALSPSLIDSYAPEKIASTHFPPPKEGDMTKKSERENKEAATARALAESITSLKAALQSTRPFGKTVEKTCKQHPKSLSSVVSDLLSHKLTSHYYLESIGNLTESKSDLGYVATLREVRYLPRDIALALADGIIRESAPNPHYSQLNFNCFDFAYPIAQLDSPWVEHFMQAFCTMFGRIGLTDIDKSKSRFICEYFSAGAL
ncbi:hypothetical protein [Lysobacter sp. Hz 25]|uniref:hypothetical protein n=1 Tax=Lysobacter sp. Hz 25 TaxID=3383698 RepID=UPI0038D4B065